MKRPHAGTKSFLAERRRKNCMVLAMWGRKFIYLPAACRYSHK
jgi:hypothetical protein